jgi:hypothetical protein
VALGVETGSWPSTSSNAAVAHYDGSHWTLLPLPPVVDILSISGRGSGDLWLTAIPQRGGPIDGPVLMRNRNSPTWSIGSLPYRQVHDMMVVGHNDGWMSVSPTGNLSQGVLLRYVSDAWSPVPLPSIDETYLFWTLRARDEKHVYAVGYTTGPTMGNRLLASFDGAAWKTVRVPAHCGDYLADVVGVAPDVIYTNATRFSQRWTRHLCRVSADLANWESVGELAFDGDRSGQVVATGGGTVVAIWINYMMQTPEAMVATIRANRMTSTCLMAPGFGRFVAWSAPGSPNVHIFGGDHAGSMPGRHLVKRFDP